MMIPQIGYVLPLIALGTGIVSAACDGGEWDVIVVGSGPAGIVVADRMSEAGKKTLLLEQGGPSYYLTGGRARPDWLNDTDLSRVDVPGLYKSIFSIPDGNLTCAPDVVNAFQGCTVGGNTAINAGLFFQPPASDWDRYFPAGWKNDDMQSAISKVQNTQPSTDNPSQDGKRYLQSGYEAAKQWLVDGAGYADVGLNDGPEKHNKSKVFGHPIWNYQDGQRSGPVKTYLQAALQRPNFSFRTGTKVVRVVRDGETATGVETRSTGADDTANICIKEDGRIILSGGALLSPQMLMWSGIGDPEILTNLSSSGLLHLPSPDWINNTAVGDKVFDNPNTFIELKSDSISSFDYKYSDPTPETRDLYLNSRSGPYTFGSQTSAFWDFIQQGDDLVGCQGTIDSSGAMAYMENGTITLNVYGTSGLRSFGRVGLDVRGIALPSSKFYSNKLDVDQNRSTGLDDSLVPVDFEERGQLSSTLLHEHLVTRMAQDCTLFIILDCCHSGSAVELPYVFRTDGEGQISLMDNLKAGARLVTEAQTIFQDGFSYNKVGEARELLAGATSFFKGLRHFGEQQEEEGLAGGEFAGQYGSEMKMVTMFSGCRDDQTSADAHIQGEPTGAMTWAFLEVMKRNRSPTYAETLTLTRKVLDESNYSQVPQLSSGLDIDLDHMALVL